MKANQSSNTAQLTALARAGIRREFGPSAGLTLRHNLNLPPPSPSGLRPLNAQGCAPAPRSW